MVRVYHFRWVPEAQRLRLALAGKGVEWEDHPLDYQDDATFFELGVARRVPVLRIGTDSGPLTDVNEILWRIDELFPDTPPLVTGRLAEEAWRALLDWRSRADALLQRLYAPLAPAWQGLGDDPDALAAYRSEVEGRFGVSLEALANDRYAGYTQFARMSRLPELAAMLARERFYAGRPSIADAVLGADLFPLQLLDGVALPIDLLYYLERVTESFGLDLRRGLLSGESGA